MPKAPRKVVRTTKRRRNVRKEIERKAGLIAIIAAISAVAIVGIVLVVYSLTRPPQVPDPSWPDFSATIVRKQPDKTVRQQIWYRSPTWCARIADERWSVSYKRADVSVAKLPSGKTAFQIAEGSGDGPVPGFGYANSTEASSAFREDRAKIVRNETVAGRSAYVIRISQGQGAQASEKTWWIDERNGLTLRYLEKSSKETFADWTLDDLRFRPDGPPWSEPDAAGIDALTGGEYEIVSVGGGGGPQERVVPPDQRGPYIDLAKRVFEPCKPGSKAKVPDPTPAAATGG